MQANGKRVGEQSLFRNILALGLVSFFTDMSSEMVFQSASNVYPRTPGFKYNGFRHN